jgi:hypothetical protein
VRPHAASGTGGTHSIDGFLVDAVAGAGNRTLASIDDLAASLRRSLGGLLLP